jgi:hypothetical protein
MGKHDFAALFEQYPPVVRLMARQFTAHKFILELARQNQRLYVEALYAYREGAPFQAVHHELARLLNECRLVERDGDELHSQDIFTVPQGCSRWRRIA